MTRYRRVPRVQVLAVALSTAFVLFLGFYVWLSVDTGPTRFPDPGLEAAVLDALNGAGRAFSPPELERITELDARARGITSLEGIAQLARLEVLNLQGNRVEDLSPLASLPRLQEVNLRDNNMTDLEGVNLPALVELEELRSLDLQYNRGPSHPESPGDHERLSDISVLSDFEQLEALDLAHNHISDIRSIAGLTGLRRLDLHDNPLGLEDLAVLASLTQLEHLNLRETDITGLSGIQELRNLVYLNLHSNSDISRIAPVAELPRLRTLILRGVPVGREIRIIETLPSLVRLNIRDTDVSDMAPLARLMERGALQDDLDSGVFAEVDIRENPVHRRGDPDGYQVLEPYWQNISIRSPQELPPPLETGPL
ncbi:MAG: leucine-rich repeat domain-containing protein [bacterium]